MSLSPSPASWPPSFQQRIYVHHTDSGGVVYHANYLAFAEYARSEFCRDLGMPLTDLQHQTGGLFVVRHVEADYHAPARLDDLIEVRTTPQCWQGGRLIFCQKIFKTSPQAAHSSLLVSLKMTLAWVNRDMKPQPLPKIFVQRLNERLITLGS